MDRLDKAIELYKQISNSCDDAKEKCETCKKSKECDFYCDFASPMDVSFYLNQIGDLFSKEPSIQLKNIDLSEVTLEQQINKVVEERAELFDALNKFKEDEDTKEHVIEELYDNIQALLGLVQKFGINAEEVMEGYQKHLDKMEQRGNKPR